MKVSDLIEKFWTSLDRIEKEKIKLSKIIVKIERKYEKLEKKSKKKKRSRQ